jgi:succinate dehydrogenase / fumarate reductase membrane anchor subunit
MSAGKPTRAEIQTPSTRYGNQKASTRHFITQRATGALNIVFTLFMVWFVVSLAGKSMAEMVALAGNPLVAIGLALMVISVAIHMRNGLRDVLEDYFEGRNYALTMLLNTLFAGAFLVVALGAIAILVFRG